MNLDLSNMDGILARGNARVVAESAEAIRSVALSIYSDTTTPALEAGSFGSPVASGRLVASTRVGINEIDNSSEAPDPDYTYPDGKGPRPLPPRTIRNRAISRVSATLRKFKLGDSIYISNSVPYIRKIEIGGHSWQTPGGVFAPTVRKALRQFSNLKLSVNRG